MITGLIIGYELALAFARAISFKMFKDSHGD